MAEMTIRLVSGSFALGFQVAAPFLVFGFALSVGLGVLARLMPRKSLQSTVCGVMLEDPAS